MKALAVFIIVLVLILVIVMAAVANGWRRKGGRVSGGGQKVLHHPLGDIATLERFMKNRGLWFKPLLDAPNLNTFLTTARGLHEKRGAQQSVVYKVRSDERVKDIVPLIPEEAKIVSMLDVGCGELDITAALASAVGAREVAATDVRIPKTVPAEITFTATSPEDATASRIPFESGRFDLVTAFMSIHHFASPDVAVREIVRVTAPGGVVLIREHDANNAGFHRAMEAIHGLYATVLSDEQTVAEFVVAPHHAQLNRHWFMEQFQKAGITLRQVTAQRGLLRSFYLVGVKHPVENAK